jgi:tetratricopeptide (TPR) repeat protein
VLGEVFRVQGEVAERIARSMDVVLIESERNRLADRATDNAEAYQYYLRGNDYFNRGLGDPDIVIAASMYERAIALDPEFSLAYAALGKAHARTAFQGYGDTGEQSKINAERALELAPELPQAHEALGWYYYWVGREYEKARDHFDAARRKQPNSSEVLLGLGLSERRLGLWDEALEALETAFTLDPLSGEKAIEVGISHVYARQYVEAADYFRRAVAIAPDQHRGYAHLAAALVAIDHALDGAVRVLREGAALIGESEFVTRQLGPNVTEEIRWLLPELFPQVSARLSSEDLGSRKAPYYVMMGEHHARLGQADAQRAYGDSAILFLDRPDWRRDIVLAPALGAERDEVLRWAPLYIEHWSHDARRLGKCHHEVALAYLMVEEYEPALEHLEAFAAMPSENSVAMLRFNPIWDPLRSHPRFQALLEKYENQKQ